MDNGSNKEGFMKRTIRSFTAGNISRDNKNDEANNDQYSVDLNVDVLDENANDNKNKPTKSSMNAPRPMFGDNDNNNDNNNNTSNSNNNGSKQPDDKRESFMDVFPDLPFDSDIHFITKQKQTQLASQVQLPTIPKTTIMKSQIATSSTKKQYKQQ